MVGCHICAISVDTEITYTMILDSFALCYQFITCKNSLRLSLCGFCGVYIRIFPGLIKNYQMNSTKGIISFDLDDTIADGCVQAYFFQGLSAQQQDEVFSTKLPWCSTIQTLLAKPIKNRTFEKAREVYRQIPINHGMVELIRFLHAEGYELVLISGGNKMFAEDYLRMNQIENCFTEVIANAMEYSDEGGFKYSPFCLKTVRCESVNCRPPCKRKLILDYLKDRDVGQYYHVGDGRNDFCPMTLTKGTKAFIRKDNILHKDLNDNQELIKEIPGELVYWTSGLEIIDHFKN